MYPPVIIMAYSSHATPHHLQMRSPVAIRFLGMLNMKEEKDSRKWSRMVGSVSCGYVAKPMSLLLPPANWEKRQAYDTKTAIPRTL